jgi:hypothetical protein
MSEAKTTIRMRRAPDQTLHGYVFTDDDHARQWLSSLKVTASEVRLERVVVGELQRCNRCGGQGHTQSIKKLHDIELEELLRDRR